MENHAFHWENPLYMAIFHSYIKLPEGNPYYDNKLLLHCFHEEFAPPPGPTGLPAARCAQPAAPATLDGAADAEHGNPTSLAHGRRRRSHITTSDDLKCVEKMTLGIHSFGPTADVYL